MGVTNEAVPLLTFTEAARRLKCSRDTVRRLVEGGYLTNVPVGSTLRRCREDEVNAMTRGQSGIPTQSG